MYCIYIYFLYSKSPSIFSGKPTTSKRLTLTGWHDMEDARLQLTALVVAAPTEESAVIQLGHRYVRGRRVCTVTGDVCLRYVHRFHCIIEFPSERYFRRVRLQLAGNSRGLLSRHAEHPRLPVLTYRHDCKMQCKIAVERVSIYIRIGRAEYSFASAYKSEVEHYPRNTETHLVSRDLLQYVLQYSSLIICWINEDIYTYIYMQREDARV